MSKTQIIILAAGHGKRMGNKEVPKVLVPLAGNPLITHLLKAVKQSGICPKPVIVIGQKAEQVKIELGPSYTYVLQKEQLGTGHAVNCVRDQVEGFADYVIVLYGDMPLVKAETIQKIVSAHWEFGNVITMATFKVPDFSDWKAGFFGFGRIIRNGNGKIHEIVEKKDATKAQLEIRELNPSYFCFNADWLWENLDKIKNDNAQAEYYLTDLAKIACDQGKEITDVSIQPEEALGVNTQEQLDQLEKLISGK